jgi:hypothetical protein
MQRFKKYIGRDFLLENVKGSEPLRLSGFLPDYLPDSTGDFDELEFSSEWDAKRLLMCIAVLNGKVKRIMFVVGNSEDPDDVRPLSEGELKEVLDQRGLQLVHFFESITQ